MAKASLSITGHGSLSNPFRPKQICLLWNWDYSGDVSELCKCVKDTWSFNIIVIAIDIEMIMKDKCGPVSQ